VRAGKILYLGLSNFTGWQIQKALAVAERHGLPSPVAVQPQYNLLVREIEWEIVPSCEHAGLGLLPWSPLGGGWLSGKYRRDEAPDRSTRLGEGRHHGVEAFEIRNPLQRTWDVVAALQDIARERGSSAAQVALAWMHDRPGVTSVILGARTLDQLTDNLGAVGLRLTPEETSHLDAASDPRPADYPYGAGGQLQRSRAL
jgi:aryl-alcohol dehydrogenase-like predicted oxidoreductase